MNPFLDLTNQEKNVFTFILRQGETTKDEIVRAMGIKLTTLNRVMKRLLDSMLIEETGIAESSGGRKPVIYGVDSRNYRLIGVDISRSDTIVTMTDFKLEILARVRFPMNSKATPDYVLEQIEEVCHQMLSSNNINKDMLLAVGVGTVGPLDREKGVILNPSNFTAEGWQDVAIKERLGKSLDKRVFIDNGANSALWGEIQKGKLHNKKIAYFNLGKGIRSSFYSGNNILRATENLEDAFAHMTVDINGRMCQCGNRGCLECYCTVESIESIYEEQSGEKKTIKDICEVSDKGDEQAGATVNMAAEYFGTGLANFINILGPFEVVISGPIIRSCSSFFEKAIAVAKGKIITKSDRIIFTDKPAFGEDAIAVGAAMMCLQELLEEK